MQSVLNWLRAPETETFPPFLARSAHLAITPRDRYVMLSLMLYAVFSEKLQRTNAKLWVLAVHGFFSVLIPFSPYTTVSNTKCSL